MSIISGLLKPYKGLRKEIYIIFISRTINSMGAMIFPFFALLLCKKIGLSSSEAGVWLAIAGILFLIAALIGGKLADVFGRKGLIVISEVLGAVCYTVCFFIEPTMWMVLFLMLAGLFYGIPGPAHEALIADLTTTEQRQGAYSLSYLGWNIGFAFAQILAGFLFDFNYKLMFVIDAVTVFIAIALIALFVKETYDKDKIGLMEINILEKRVEGSIFEVLRIRPILIYFTLIIIGYKFMYDQWMFIIPLHTVHNFGSQGTILYGFIGSFNAVIVVFFTPILTALLLKASNLRKIVYAGILFTIGFGMLGFVSTKTAFFLSAFIFTLGEILEAISLMPFIMNHTPASHRGRIGSLTSIIHASGIILGPLVMGTVLEYSSFDTVWKIIGIIGIVATIFMKGLERYDRKQQHNTQNLEINPKVLL